MSRAMAAFLAACTLVSTFAVFGPYDIYSTNRGEFHIPFRVYLQAVLPWILAAIIALSVLAHLGGRRGFDWIVATYLGLTIALYLQGKWLVWDYGVLDGRTVPWADYPWRSLFDAAMWVGCLGGCWALRVRVSRHAFAIAGVFLAVQAAAAVPTFFSGEEPFEPPNEMGSMHLYSPERNVVVLLLDGFQSTAFDELLISEPGWRQALDGFTYFRDTVAPFPTTKLSLPAILSGALYDNRESMPRFLEDSLRTRSLPSLLHRSGYRVDLTTRARFCKRLEARNCAELSSYVEHNPQRLVLQIAARLLDVSLFRQAPHSLKPVVMAEGNWRFARLVTPTPGTKFHAESIDFVEALKSEARVGSAAPTFKLLHLFVPHLPIRLDADCRDSGGDEPEERTAYLEQAHCALQLTRRMLAVLEDLQVYDSTLVVVLADHGLDLDWGLPTRPGYPNPGPALPLLLVKPFAARGVLSQSDAPASLIDVPNTLGALLELDRSFPGRNLFEIADTQRRRRVHRDYKWKREYWWGLHIDHMQEYVIDGPARDGSNWSRGRVLGPGRLGAEADPEG